MTKQNKYPKAKKCPSCGKLMADGENCYATKCLNQETNVEKKSFISKYKHEWPKK